MLGTLSLDDFMKWLKEKGYNPCKPHWFKRNHWTIDEAVLIFYNFEPSMFKTVDYGVLKDFIESLDEEDGIYGILKSHIPSVHFPRVDNLRVEEISKFLDEKGIKIPKHFPKDLLVSNDNNEVISKDDQNFNRWVPKKGMRDTSIRIDIVRQAAYLCWKQEKKEGKPYTKPSDLARNSKMIEMVEKLNEITGLPPVMGEEYKKSGVDPEWFSDLYPGDKKPGPKPKNEK